LSCLSLTGPTYRGPVARHAVEPRPDITWNPGPACCGICKRWRPMRAGASIESLVADATALGAEVLVVDAEASALVRNQPERD
jgi:hypothetical protein